MIVRQVRMFIATLALLLIMPAEAAHRVERIELTGAGSAQHGWMFTPATAGHEPAIWIFLAGAGEARALVSNPLLVAGAEQHGNILFSMEIPDNEAFTASIPVMLQALEARGQHYGRIYLIGLNDGATTALRIASEGRLRVNAVLALGGPADSLPDSADQGVSVLFVVGQQDDPALIDKMADVASTWAAALGCATRISANVPGISQRGYYGCRDDAKVVFATVEDQGSEWPGRLNLDTLARSYFNGYAN